MDKNNDGWMIFFSSLPTRPVSKRMKVWRKLVQEGALHFKGAVYLLPCSADREKMLMALVADVSAMGGEAALVKTKLIETMDDASIIALFNADRSNAYAQTHKRLHALEQKVASLTKGGKSSAPEELLTEFRKIEKTIADIAAVDFFGSETGADYARRLRRLAEQLDAASHGRSPETAPAIQPKDPAEYRTRIWATRTRPFVDRMASAWLIRRFIDTQARLVFVADAVEAPAGSVLFDMSGGEFTHHGDLCTFEVLIKSFGLKQRPLKKLAELVHELDIKDGRYKVPEASGIEELLTGIRKIAKNDEEALEKGMAVFEILYQSQSV
ncbi:MAG TPA: chromate resistance protein ChrB domain-containing protein [Dissulfurispiraceae bacterium]|nr:chromate resistance protein ChrB domain-containing protein [Dissulfurispiraceae bacterium]